MAELIEGCSRGSGVEEEYSKLHLESMKKQNKLLDLEIERKQLELEIRQVELKHLQLEHLLRR